MKRGLIFAAAVLLLAGAVLWGASRRSLSLSVGHCLVGDNGSCMLVVDNSPIQLSDRTKNVPLPGGLSTGDKILVLHDGVAESYPARTGTQSVNSASSTCGCAARRSAEKQTSISDVLRWIDR